MRLIGRLLASPKPEQQQELVAGIDHRMNRFRQHGRAASQECRNEFCGCDRGIRSNGCIHCDRLF